MARRINYLISGSGLITAVVSGRRPFQIPRDHPKYNEIIQAINADDVDALVNVADLPRAIETASNGLVQVRDGRVYYNGQESHLNVAERILEMVRLGLKFDFMARFLENLMQNPSRRAVRESYPFLERHGLPITEDGCFLAYKRVRPDWTDCHTGKVVNTIGSKVSMPRNEVDDNWGTACSEGFHVGAMSYVATFENSPGNRIIIVKVNPRDVVTVPRDETDKLRTCAYEVIEEYTGELSFGPVYTASAPVAPVAPSRQDAPAPAAPTQAQQVVADRTEEDNLARWVESGEAHRWVLNHHRQWEHQDWVDLVNQLRQSSYWPMYLNEVGTTLERLKAQDEATLEAYLADLTDDEDEFDEDDEDDDYDDEDEDDYDDDEDDEDDDYDDEDEDDYDDDEDEEDEDDDDNDDDPEGLGGDTRYIGDIPTHGNP